MVETDVVIVGAGPVGLFQVFELGLLGLRAHLVDAMPQAGGQCAELYPDKPIYDIPALPVCGARELIERLQQQIAPFAPQFHLGQTITALRARPDGRFELGTSTGLRLQCGAVVIAAGLGAFEPRRLALPAAAGFEGQALHYQVRDAVALAGQEIVIAGGGDSALDWALTLAETAAGVVLVHRSQKFKAAPASVARMHALCEAQRMQFLEGEIIGLEGTPPRLRALRVQTRAGLTTRIEAQQLLVFWGLHPRLGPIADWGLALEKHQIAVDTARFETSIPGVYAVGDINTYPGKKKLILSGFHEAALAAFAVKERLSPGEKVHLQYTTTSPLLHRRLHVQPDLAGLDVPD